MLITPITELPANGTYPLNQDGSPNYLVFSGAHGMRISVESVEKGTVAYELIRCGSDVLWSRNDPRKFINFTGTGNAVVNALAADLVEGECFTLLAQPGWKTSDVCLLTNLGTPVDLSTVTY